MNPMEKTGFFRYRALLMNVVRYDKSGKLLPTEQRLSNSLSECETWGRNALDSLTPGSANRKNGFVRITELTAVPIMDIHGAKILGEFAIADYRAKPLVSIAAHAEIKEQNG